MGTRADRPVTIGGVDPAFGEMLDTSPEQRRRYYELLRSLTPAQRAAKLSGLSHMVRGLAEAGIRARNSGVSRDEIRRQLAEILYGRAAAERLFGRR